MQSFGTILLLLLSSAALVLLGHVFRLLRWEQFIRIYEYPQRRSLLRAMAGGYAVNFLLPFHVGDFLRAALAGRKMKTGTGFAFATVIMDRFLDVWVVALLFGGFRLAGLGGAAVLGAARYYLVFALLLAAALVLVVLLRHLNREYILKRTEEIEELEKAIADLEDVLKRPARIRKIIMTELGDVAKKYGSPRKTEILYDLPDDSAADEQNEIPDYPVTVFFTREGYFKKITPQSLRMSGEQKLKDGDEVVYTKETTNSAELLFFTNHAQVYKSRASEFADTKASVLGDYVASKLEMEEGEVPLFMTVTVDYRGYMLFFYQNGKCAKIPLASYMTKQNRRKLLKAYSDKEELAAMLHIEEETELAVFTSGGTGGPRLILVGSALIPEKATRDTAGINMVTLKKNARIAKVRPAAGLELKDPHRYRVRTLPAAGALLRQEDTTEQMSL